MPSLCLEGHYGDMSAATFTPAPGRPSGATPLSGLTHRHRVGQALRAVRVIAGAAFDVVILGEYGEEAGVVRRHR
ncbi:hypothetical protein QFZ32_005140 [Streptomyces canus]|uniref:Uncharacterized protein n=2 Tax=Streptomyces canus TaxID=58343 RepID=A0AAW8FLK0_9ACTN|nr:hypothetical protein [Streptomyces canus]MDQ0909698.1 hypothetical protein [Streptomyces canus]MDQ1069700.1 hypothetical protein [Streptomyces canus]